MKKVVKIACYIILSLIMCYQANALVKAKKSVLSSNTRIKATSFINYPPFGSKGELGWDIKTAFQPFVDTFHKQTSNEMEYHSSENYKESIFKVVNGEIDVLLGAYYDTPLYNGLQLIYPAIMNNPLVLVTMPNSSNRINSKEDLKKLKGAIDSREYLSGYVTNELKQYNIQKFDDSYKLYEQLFVGNVDYILTSRYYGALEQAKLGIRDMVIMSKNALWDMPLFIAVSAVNRKARITGNTIKEVLKTNAKRLKNEIEEYIIEEIRKADEASIGVVPPAFIK